MSVELPCRVLVDLSSGSRVVVEGTLLAWRRASGEWRGLVRFVDDVGREREEWRVARTLKPL